MTLKRFDVYQTDPEQLFDLHQPNWATKPSPLVLFVAALLLALLMTKYQQMTKDDRYQRWFLATSFLAWLAATYTFDMRISASALSLLPAIMLVGLIMSDGTHSTLRVMRKRQQEMVCDAQHSEEG